MVSRVDLFHLVDLLCVPSQLTAFSELPSKVKCQPNVASQRKDISSSITDIDLLGSHVTACKHTIKSLCEKHKLLKHLSLQSHCK